MDRETFILQVNRKNDTIREIIGCLRGYCDLKPLKNKKKIDRNY